MKKAIIITLIATITVTVLTTKTKIANAKILPENITYTINTTINNVVNVAQKNIEKNDILRNKLVIDTSTTTELKTKENELVNDLVSTLSKLNNIQSRIETKTDEMNASETDTASIKILLASSTEDAVLAQNIVSQFASSTLETPENPTGLIDLAKAHQLANAAINAVNVVRDDLQSALKALTIVY